MVEDFYDELQLAINNKPASVMLILMEDFNAKVGTDYQNWDGVLGKFGMGDCNERGENFSTSAPQMVSSLPTLASSKAKYLENGLGSPQMEPTTTKLTTSLLIGKWGVV